MSGRAVIAGNKLTFGLTASTKIYCEELMDIEQKYEAVLSATQSFRIEEGLLKFEGASGGDVITLARAPGTTFLRDWGARRQSAAGSTYSRGAVKLIFHSGADKGYFNGEEIAACEAAGIEVYVPKPATSNSRAQGRFDKRRSVSEIGGIYRDDCPKVPTIFC